MANERMLLFPTGELSDERAALIQQAGEKHGVSIVVDEKGLTISNLSPTQQARLAQAVQEHWGIPFNGTRVRLVAEE